MTTKITLLVALMAYAVIASQPFMYIFSLKHVQLNLNANSYIELRKLTDTAMRANFKYVLYVALLANIALAALTIKTPNSILFMTTTIALVALIADVMLTLKGSLPINDVMNTWSADNYPSNWQDFRAQWFAVFQYRQIAGIIGFVSLAIGAVFGSK